MFLSLIEECNLHSSPRIDVQEVISHSPQLFAILLIKLLEMLY